METVCIHGMVTFDFSKEEDKQKYKLQAEQLLKEFGIDELQDCLDVCREKERYEQCAILKTVIDKFYTS